MTEHQDPRNPQYERARQAFEDLSIEDRAVFLVQETVSTVVRGIEEAGRTLSREIDALFREAEAEADAEPTKKTSTGKKSTTRKSTAKKTTAKKTTAKKSTAKKTTPKKTTAKKRTTKKTPPKDDA